jgi:hypothetical protein
MSLHIPGGTGWMQKQESLEDIQLIAEAVWHEARNQTFLAKAGVAFSVLDRGAFHSRADDIAGHLAHPKQFPWFGKSHTERRRRAMARFSEAVAWRDAVQTAALVYASDDRNPLVQRPCAGNPTMFDDAKNLQRRAEKDKRIAGIAARGCVVGGLIFWNEEM